MRKVLTSLLAFAASGLLGGMAAVQLAVWTKAQEEFILVFVSNIVVLFLATLAFFVAQFLGARAVLRTGICGVGLLILLAVLSAAASAWASRSVVPPRADLVLVGSALLAGLVMIAVHWLVVRWRSA